MKSVKAIGALFLASLALGACQSSIDFKKTSGGVPYKIFPAKKSKDTIAVNDIVKYHTIFKVGDSVLNNTYLGNAIYDKVKPPTPGYAEPLHEILTKAKEGDSIYFVQAMDSFIVHNPQIEQQTPFRKGDQVITTVRIVKVFKDEEVARAEFMKDNEKSMKENFKRIEEGEKINLEAFKKDSATQAQLAKDNKTIEDHLKSKNIQAQKTEWGVYIQKLEEGQGPKPAVGQFVKVKYKGTLLSGFKFDEGEYPFQIGTGGAIKGFEDGVRQLSKGGKAKVFVPSVLAYGTRGSGPDIGPNTSLVFDLELLEISDMPISPNPQQGAAADPHEGHDH